MQFGDRLKKMRIAAGLSQQDMAQALGIDRSTFSNYETNSTHPSIQNLFSIAKMLETTPDQLTGFAENEGQCRDGGDPFDADDRSDQRLSLLTKDEKNIILLYRMCPDKEEIRAFLAERAAQQDDEQTKTE